jgi:hypothetical protein
MPGAIGYHSRVIVLIPKTAPAAAAAAVAVLVLALVQNAIVAERSATLRVRAPRLPEVAREEAMAAAAAAGVEEEEGEDTIVSVVEVKRHGALSFCVAPRQRGVADHPFSTFSSYTCGGVGHLSRDCVQGSKCYNCSAIVRVYSPFGAIPMAFMRS